MVGLSAVERRLARREDTLPVPPVRKTVSLEDIFMWPRDRKIDRAYFDCEKSVLFVV